MSDLVGQKAAPRECVFLQTSSADGLSSWVFGVSEVIWMPLFANVLLFLLEGLLVSFGGCVAVRLLPSCLVLLGPSSFLLECVVWKVRRFRSQG